MTKKKSHPLLSALACVAVMTIAPAHATPAPVCEGSQLMTLSLGCSGPFKENSKAGDTMSFDGIDYDYASGSKPFIIAPRGTNSGILAFTDALVGHFVLGIQAGNMFSVYLFDGGENGIKTIDFDTMGVVERGHGEAGVMTDAFLFTPGGFLPGRHAPADGDENVTAPPTAQQVPEPGSGALAIVALAAAGLAARRRRR